MYLLGTPNVSPLCMFGESVFALIPDHDVRAAKLTNRWISGCWWRRSMLCLSADQLAENLLESSGADVKRSKLEGRHGILMWKCTLECLDRMWFHVQMKRCRQRRHGRKIPTVPPPAPLCLCSSFGICLCASVRVICSNHVFGERTTIVGCGGRWAQ